MMFRVPLLSCCMGENSPFDDQEVFTFILRFQFEKSLKEVLQSMPYRIRKRIICMNTARKKCCQFVAKKQAFLNFLKE